MALFKPKSAGNNGKYHGVCELGIKSFTDKSKDFDWADVFIVCEVALKDSEYTRDIRIRGSFDKDTNGDITGGSVLNRIYKFFGDIGCTAGVNIKGGWETADGKEIKDIAKYLTQHHLGTVLPDTPPDLDYVGYVYKEPNKKTGKAYNVVHYRLFPNNKTGRIELDKHVAWMKTNGYLTEAPATPTNNSALPKAIEDIL